jgi:putative ABC transport system ATP-binding protein
LSDALLEVRGVVKRFGRDRPVTALAGVSFDVRRGEIVAVRGPSGSGKTTLLHLIAGLDTPTQGSVRLGDVDVSRSDETARAELRRTRIGLVFQFFNLLPTLTALENVALPLRIGGMRRREAFAAAADMLGRVGLAERRDQLPDELSGGEQQRVAIARAMSIGPELLLADEPTGNLDSATAGEVLRLIAELRKSAGCAALIVTHDDDVARVSDRVLTLRDGSLAGAADA